MITAKMRRTGHSSYSITIETEGPQRWLTAGAHRPWAGGPVGPVRHWELLLQAWVLVGLFSVASLTVRIGSIIWYIDRLRDIHVQQKAIN